MKWSLIPADIREFYNLQSKVTPDGYVFIRIKKGMYGLKEAAILAYNKLRTHLEPKGYYPIPGTSGLWAHKTRPI